MKLLYKFLISFLLFSFNNISAKAIDVDIEPLVKYIASAEKCYESIPLIPNFKMLDESGAWYKIGEAMFSVRTSRNYKSSVTEMYSLEPIIRFYKTLEYSGVDTEICTESLNEVYKENIKN
tara:strand:- start:105 stop:467 length:363 start_codon:yes stop_codon:yes gene_type:complete